VWFQKAVSTLPPHPMEGRSLEIPSGGGGSLKAKLFKEK